MAQYEASLTYEAVYRRDLPIEASSAEEALQKVQELILYQQIETPEPDPRRTAPGHEWTFCEDGIQEVELRHIYEVKDPRGNQRAESELVAARQACQALKAYVSSPSSWPTQVLSPTLCEDMRLLRATVLRDIDSLESRLRTAASPNAQYRSPSPSGKTGALKGKERTYDSDGDGNPD
jgi:hypothetical protein